MLLWSQAIGPLGQITRLNGRRIGSPVHLWHAVVFSPRTSQDHRTLGITMPRCRCYWRALPILRVFTYYCICRTTSWRCKAAERFPTVLSAHYSGCIALLVIAQLFLTRVCLVLMHTICPTRHLNLIFHKKHYVGLIARLLVDTYSISSKEDRIIGVRVLLSWHNKELHFRPYGDLPR